MIEHRWELGLLGWALAATLLTALYLRRLRTRNATTVDAGWALSLVGIAVLDAVLGPGAAVQRVLIAVLAARRWPMPGSRASSRAPRTRDTRCSVFVPWPPSSTV